MEDGRIDRPILKDYGETLVGGSSGTNTTATYTADITTGNVFNLILNANCTFTFANPSPAGIACTITIYLKQDATGGRTVTWPSSVKWSGDVTPTITAIASRWDIFTFITTNGGSTWFGMKSGENYGQASGGYLYTAWSWGENALGQLGQNTVALLSSPVQIGTSVDWAKVSENAQASTGAIKTDGTLWTWGNNTSGGLGTNDTANHSSPTQIGTLKNWNVISASTHSAAIQTDGTLWTWGLGASGQLASNATTSRSSPVQVGTLTNWASVFVGDNHTAAVKTDGTLWTWGLHSSGQLGLNIASATLVSSPTQVGTATDWSTTTCGGANTLAIKTDGTLWAWGFNSYGRLGLGDVINRSSPVQIGTLTNWAHISMDQHGIAVKTDGTLWTWGINNQGQLGQNTAITAHRSSPVQVGTATDWSNALGTTVHSLALKGGTIWSWGYAGKGQLGSNDTTTRSSPVQIGASAGWAAIAIVGTGTSGSSFGLKA
jgi:alpha-tubulin suppressor-like RCC1 family protein